MSTTRRALLVSGLVAALASVGCAHGGIGSAEGWSVVESPHFSLHTLIPRETQLLVRDLELAHSSIGSTFFKNVDLPRVDVLVLTPETFEEVMGPYRDAIALARSPGGVAIGKDGLLITKDDKAHPDVSEALAHLYIHRSFAGAPLWFHEGFAAYLRTAEYRYGDGGQMACFGVLPAEKEPLLPVRKLLELSWDDYDGNEGRNWYRYTSRLLIDFILHGAAGKNATRMRPLVEAVGLGKRPVETIEAAFPSVALDVLDRKLSEHAADVAHQVGSASPVRGLCPLPARIPPDRAVDERKPQVSPAPAAAMAALFQAVLKLPRRTGYPPWYPPDVVARAR
jgi:hypothetical protein